MVNNSFKYEKQLFIFSDEVKKAKSYFSVLLFNNNNNNVHQIKDSFDYEELVHKICILTKQNKHYKLIKQLVKTDEALKVIVALLFKGFSWTREIYQEFNISSNLYVQNTLLTLQRLDLINKESGQKLHPILFDSMRKAKNGQIRKQLHQAEIFFITPEFIEFCTLLKPLFEARVNNSRSFRYSLENVIDSSKIFEKQYKEIIDQEETQFTRKEITDEGIEYETETLKAKEIKKAVAEFRVELLEKKEAQKQLSEKEKGELAVIKENPLALIEKDNILTLDKAQIKRDLAEAERILTNQERIDQDIEQAPLTIGEVNLRGKKLDSQYWGTSFKLSPQSAKEYEELARQQEQEDNEDEGMKFLNSL